MTLDQMEPVWKIETNETGFQFWSRSCTRKQYRVKFKCEVEVLEFSQPELDVWLGPEDSNNNYLSSQSGYENQNLQNANNRRYTTKCRADSQEDTSAALMSVLCLIVIIVTMSYKWWTFVTSA